jgi:N-acetylglucosaminyldiphosphoundecaprenol N-acetyl-beta-D-mannosaminyltransferase
MKQRNDIDGDKMDNERGLTARSAHLAHDAGFLRFTIKGIDIAAVDIAFVRAFVGERVTRAAGEYITATSAHGIVESANDDRVLQAHRQALMVVPDGLPLVWLGRLLGFRSTGHVRGSDLMQSIFARRETRMLRHFFYGSNPSVIAQLKKVLLARFGEFNDVGSYCPPIRPPGFAEDGDVLSRIHEATPHFVWVGLSTPKQELWLQMHMPKIASGIGIGVGAAFDLLSGTVPRAPRWIQSSGFEWLFRLAMEPKRLFRRYLFVIPRFIGFFIEALVVPRGET